MKVAYVAFNATAAINFLYRIAIPAFCIFNFELCFVFLAVRAGAMCDEGDGIDLARPLNVQRGREDVDDGFTACALKMRVQTVACVIPDRTVVHSDNLNQALFYKLVQVAINSRLSDMGDVLPHDANAGLRIRMICPAAQNIQQHQASFAIAVTGLIHSSVLLTMP